MKIVKNLNADCRALVPLELDVVIGLIVGPNQACLGIVLVELGLGKYIFV